MIEQANDQIKPWDKQPRETGKAFQAFAIYRDIPYQDGTSKDTRSLQAVANVLGRTRRSVDMLSAKHNWVARATAYDRHVADLATSARVDDINSRLKTQMSTASFMRRVAREAYENVDNKSLGAEEARRLLVDSAKIEEKAIRLMLDIFGQEAFMPEQEEEVQRAVVILPAKKEKK